MYFTLHVMLIILFNSLIDNELHSTQSLCGDIHVNYHTYFRNHREIQENTQKYSKNTRTQGSICIFESVKASNM